MARHFNWKFFLLIATLEVVAGKRIKDMIYSSINHVAPCFRRHNGTHQFGCSSSRSGNIGAIHFTENEADLRWLEQNSTAGPYIAVLPISMFKRDILFRLKDTNINGVLVTNTSGTRPQYYSPEDTCPNRYSGINQCDDKKPWNPLGSSLLMEDWPFPIFFLDNESTLREIRSCFREHNAHDLETQKQRSLCALEMKSFMYAAVDTRTCIRRNFLSNIHSISFCDPLGDRNIHWYLTPTIKETESLILVVARLDATAMFDGYVPGAGSTITGLATFLATAFYLNSLNATVNNTNVIFTVFNGEAYDYIGSSRMVYNLQEKKFKSFSDEIIDFKQISTVIELGQLGSGPLYLHTKNSDNSMIASDLKDSLPATILKDSIPPASVQSFLKADSNLSTIVIANHGQQFVNNYYHSLLDDKENLGDRNELDSRIAKVAISLGNALFKSITGKEPPKSEVEIEKVEKIVPFILPCYVETANCTLFLAATLPGTTFENKAFPLYVGVRETDNYITYLTGHLLALFTGDEIHNMNASSCTKHNNLFWMKGYHNDTTGICVNATVLTSKAMSPAFIIDGYDMTSGLYSTWTESVWENFSVRMFLKPPAATERLSIILGSSVAIISIILVWFINSRSKIIFNTSTAEL